MMIKAYVMDVNENGVLYSGHVEEIDNSPDSIRRLLDAPYMETFLTDGIVVLSSKDQEDANIPINRAIKDSDSIDNVKLILRGKLICVISGNEGYMSVDENDIAYIKKVMLPVFQLGDQIFISDGDNTI